MRPTSRAPTALASHASAQKEDHNIFETRKKHARKRWAPTSTFLRSDCGIKTLASLCPGRPRGMNASSILKMESSTRRRGIYNTTIEAPSAKDPVSNPYPSFLPRDADTRTARARTGTGGRVK